MSKTIAEHMKDVLLEHGHYGIWRGHADLVGDAYSRYDGKVEHPYNRTSSVLGSCRKSDLFIQEGYIRASNINATTEYKHPYFVLSVVRRQAECLGYASVHEWSNKDIQSLEDFVRNGCIG